MEKMDFKKLYKELYRAPKDKVVFVDVPSLQYLVVDGKGDPNGPEFQAAMATLYPLAYTLKFMGKETGTDWTVAPLEGLWGVATGDFSWDLSRDEWVWTAMIMQPDLVNASMLSAAVKSAAGKKDLPLGDRLELRRVEEGLSAQIMHIGPYTEERPTVARLHEAIEAAGYRCRMRHHEVYIGNPQRVAPEKLKTILRHPVEEMST